MNRIGLALAAVALASAPVAAHAQRAAASGSPGATSDAKGGAPKLSDKDLAANKARGLKEAPAVLAASGVACEIADANYMGQGDEKDANGKSLGKLTAYEVACKTGPGYVLVSRPSNPKPQVINCIIAAQGQTKCALPQNTDFKASLAPYVKQAGRQCTISDLRYVGSSTTAAQDFYEIACAPPQTGFILGASSTGAAPVVNDCLLVLGTKQECQLTPKAQIVQSFAPAVAKSGKPCQISDVRSMGRSKDGQQDFTEIACGSAAGFVLVTDSAGAFKSVLDCAKAQGVGEGCKLTDVTTAATAEAATYTKLAAKAGFPCNVKQYRFIGMDKDNHEVVELACNDRPDGALAVFSETGAGSQIFDCVRAPAIGDTTCKLTQASVVFPKYAAALAAKGRATCKVSNAVFLGRTTNGQEFVETACADGAPGWVMGFKSGATTADELLTCKQATNSGLPCKLPSNLAGNKGS